MENKKLVSFVENLLFRGKYSFTLDEVRSTFHRKDSAVKASLFRLVKKGLIVTVRKGFYVIVPPEYHVRGVLPPVLFADDCMRNLNRDYYAGLLSAAALHGAAHQQPQEFFIVTSTPALRTITVKGIKIRFLTRREMPAMGIEVKKTDTGTIRVSSPELTAIDLVLFQKRVGGLNRVAEIVAELIERIKPDTIGKLAEKVCPLSVVQRLGYLVDNIINNKPIAEALFSVLQKRPFFPVLLTAAKDSTLIRPDNRWKVRVNTMVEIDV